MYKIVLKGGLGNQLFQYAAIYSLSRRKNVKFVLDLSFLKNRLPVPGFEHRDYELKKFFKIEAETSTFLNSDLLERYISYPLLTIYYRVLKSKYHYLEKDPYHYDTEFFNLPDESLIEGYFNNYKYFDSYKKDLIELFNVDNLYNKKFQAIEDKIKSMNSVSLNIRRGDYTNSKNASVFTQLDESYYLPAIKYIRSNIENPHFYVFSFDDPDWFKEKLNLQEHEFTYMNKSYVGDDFKTYFRLISLCKHNIISNSTFAFWAAYLNKNKNKIVISPNSWSNIWESFENPSSWVVF